MQPKLNQIFHSNLLNWQDLLSYAQFKVFFCTLSGQCCIETSIERDKLTLFFNINEGTGRICEDQFIAIYRRYLELKTQNLHHVSSMYQTPIWEDTASSDFAPYVAAIINDYIKTKCTKPW